MKIQTKLFLSFVFVVSLLVVAEVGAVPLISRAFNLNFAREAIVFIIFFIFCSVLFLTLIQLYFSLPIEEFQKYLLDTRKNKGFVKFQKYNEPAELKMVHRAIRAIVRDLEEKTQTLQKSKKLDQLKVEFIATASHQLRTPLTGLKWALSIVQQTISAKDKISELVCDALDSVNRMIALVNTMIYSIRAVDESAPSSMKHIDLEALISDVIKENRLIAASRSVSVSIRKVKKMIPSIDGNPEQIRTIFQNLLSNAIRYNKEGGTVVVSINSKQNFVVVKVKDTGIGIPLDEKHSLFERFVRGKEAQKLYTQGSGLGLFLTSAMVVRYGGELSFTSTYKKGTTFTVKLPIKHSGELESFIQY